MLTGSYNTGLVFASLLVAMLASYTALDMAGRVASAQGRAARGWLIGGSVAMGIGIWSMHFLGMLAFNLPIPMGYDPTVTFLSLLIAIASSAVALRIVCHKELSLARLCMGAVLMGAGVASMHYMGMAAMRMTPAIQYDPVLLVLSIVIAIVASGTALWIASRLRDVSTRTRIFRAGAAVVMGLAIAGMHYTGMAAAKFPMNSSCRMAREGFAPLQMAPLILVLAISVLSIALIISLLDFRLESRTAVLSSSLAYANQELQFLVLHDNLTKLPNRALLEDRLEQEIQNAKREMKRFSVLFLDLDGFKQVNDAYGHHAGDLLLMQVADRIRGNVRARDTLARIGGDEFALLANTSEPADAATLAGKLVEEISKPFMIARHEVRVSVSVGIAVFDSEDRDNEDLLRNADAAMYHAKALGRNTYCFFDTSMNDDAQKELQLVSDLRNAQEKTEWVLHYQPTIDAQSGAITGAEALLRWNHPTRGMVPPNLFIPAAEKTGLIVPIGEWVLNEACRQMNEWREAGFSNWTIAVNLSAVQFNHPDLIKMVRDTLDRHRLEPQYLTLEITESTAMRDVHASLAILRQLHQMGVQISIDDFGTGYSSLMYLKRLPANELKIDRGFVCDLAHDTEDAAIIAAIVALGHTLNLRIVAEGVETTEQRAFLSRLGCTALQGFLFGKPMAADQFLQMAQNPEFKAQVFEMPSNKRTA
ncbi:MAG TPA: EAL domain-containing protein [Terracidiphilus sp.]|nr:EAL domain-containing protein [Terracidiphilus sp.]